MKTSISLLLLLMMATIIKAQDATVQDLKAAASASLPTADTSKKANKKGWITGGLINLNLAQVSNYNWIASGGDKFSLAIGSALNLYANRKWKRNTWENTLDIQYGLVNTTTLGYRKTTDRLDFISKYGYLPNNWKNISLSSLLQLRSQIANGYEYDYLGTTSKRRNSGFFAPAYITLAPIGFDWKPNAAFSLFGSPAVARWTIASNDPYSYASPNGFFNGKKETPLATLYGVDTLHPVRGEFGAFITATFKKDIMKNVNYYSKLDLYSNYLSNPQNVDVFWTNQIKMKVNKWIQVTYTLDMLYDDDVKNPLKPTRPNGLQLLSSLSVGFAAKL